MTYVIYDYTGAKVSLEFENAEDVDIALRYLSWVYDLGSGSFAVAMRSGCREKMVNGSAFLNDPEARMIS